MEMGKSKKSVKQENSTKNRKLGKRQILSWNKIGWAIFGLKPRFMMIS